MAYCISKNDDELVFAGCSPCQFWSKVNTDKSKSEKTAFLLLHFQRFIKEFLPGFVIIENVPGLKNKKEQSNLPNFLDFLEKNGYKIDDGVVNASYYGVPQHRLRYLMLATRLNYITPKLPTPNKKKVRTVRDAIGTLSRVNLNPLKAGERDSFDFLHRAAALSPENLSRIKKTPKDGGDRKSWKDTNLQIKAYENRDKIFKDVYGRMYWDRPAPTITTRFHSLSNGRFGHPEQDRAISLREGAILQTFPKHFIFHGKTEAHIAKQIGNAVPPELAKRIGLQLKRLATYG
jgi:DNA (cytosine-5)-methyltransferase 1